MTFLGAGCRPPPWLPTERCLLAGRGSWRCSGGSGGGARGGQPTVVLVEGEAGIGKSTLLARFAVGLAGAAVLRASGDEAELRLPYGIVGQLVCVGA